MKIHNRFAELKGRIILHWARLILIGVSGWLPRSIVVLLAVGFIPALIFSYAGLV